MSLGSFKNRLFHIYWGFSRGLTMGAQAVIIDEDNRILLIRHGYRPGWHFPGGGVEKNETVRQALEREIEEEAGVVLRGEPDMHGIFSNFKVSKVDHIVVFVVRHWEQPSPPTLGFEIAEWGFFDRNDLPDGVVKPVTSRLAEILDGSPISSSW